MTRKTYLLRKQINGKKIHYGTYYSLEQREQARKLFEKCNWDKTQQNRIYEKLGIYKKPKYYYYLKEKNKYVVVKWNGNTNDSYGLYETEEQAKIIVEELRKVAWNKTKLKEICNKYGFKYDYDPQTKNYYFDKTRQQWKVYKIVNNKPIHITYCASEKEARKIVEKIKK